VSSLLANAALRPPRRSAEIARVVAFLVSDAASAMTAPMCPLIADGWPARRGATYGGLREANG